MRKKMKITKTQLREMIREEILKEKYIDPEDAPMILVNAIQNLQSALKGVKNPEKWAGKYHRSLPGLVEMIYSVTKILTRMK